MFAGPRFVEIEKFWYHSMFILASTVPLSSALSCFAGLMNIPHLLNCLINGILPSTGLESGDQRPSQICHFCHSLLSTTIIIKVPIEERDHSNGAIIRGSITNETLSVETNELIDFI